MDWGTRKNIEKVFFSYKDYMKQLVVSTVEWAESNMAVDYTKVAVKTSPGNYKESQLCALMDMDQCLMRWCYVIEKVLEHYKFEQEKVRFINTYYFNKKGEVETCICADISRATFYRWKEEVLQVAYNWAKSYKLIGTKNVI